MARRTQTFDVFVGNLPQDANEKNIGKLFVQYGEIQGIIVRDANNIPNTKIAYVKFLCEPDADRACSEMNGMDVEGKTITVKRSEGRKKLLSDSVGGPIVTKPKFQGFKGPDIVPAEDRNSGGFSPVLSSVEQMSQAERETAMITHVESPITLWIQIVSDENTKRIYNITEQLSSLCPAARKITDTPDQNKTYAANFSEDGLWYRCQVKQLFGTDRFKIQYIDYGNTEEVLSGSLVEIPHNLACIPGLAEKVILNNTRPKDLSDKKGIEFLKRLTDGQMAQVIKTKQLTDGTGYYAHVFIAGKSLAELAVQEGFATWRPLMGNKPHDGVFSAPVDFTGPPGGAGDRPVFHQSGKSNVIIGREDGGKELKAELTKKKRELERVKNDKDVAVMEMGYLKSKLKNMQDEFQGLATKMAENTISNRLKTLIGLAAKIRKFRSQFPTGNNSTLEEAMSLVQSADKVDNTSSKTLPAVVSSLSTYRAAQKEISTCKCMNELQDLINARDLTRKDLHVRLTVCLEELDKIPLQERKKNVELMEKKLNHTYSQFNRFVVHECPSLENLRAGFKTWKAKKNAEFEDVRMATDFSERAVQEAFVQVKKMLSLSATEISEKLDLDLDGLLTTYEHALQRELVVTDLEHTKDSSLVATLLTSVRQELKTEFSTLDNFCQLQKEFTQLRDSIVPWLKDMPSLDKLQESRKVILALKSKLRHKLADKQDLEEVNASGVEMETILAEVETLKSQLQGALVTADEHLAEIADIADTNFPELKLQHPDLGLEQYVLWQGLVKVGREIDHYTLQEGYRSGTYKTMFDGIIVNLQEFTIKSEESCSKVDFMAQVMRYNQATKSLQAVFFSKNERQAYIQYPWQEGREVLESAVKSWKYDAKALQQIAKNALTCIADLHDNNFIYGNINPQVFILDPQTLQVEFLLPDFSVSLRDRASKKYQTENGFPFFCPEPFLVTSPAVPEGVSAAVDLFNLALLLFWIHFPNERVSFHANSLPDPKSVKMDASLLVLVTNLLSGTHNLKITARQLLSCEYFVKTVQDKKEEEVKERAPTQKSSSVGQPSQGFQENTQLITPVPKASPKHHPIIPVSTPMEIGVFRVEDVMVQEEVLEEVDDDDDSSWTTASKSTSGSSRNESPLDTVVEETSRAEHVSQPDIEMSIGEWKGIEAEQINQNLDNSGIDRTYIDKNHSFVPVRDTDNSAGSVTAGSSNFSVVQCFDPHGSSSINMLPNDSTSISTQYFSMPEPSSADNSRQATPSPLREANNSSNQGTGAVFNLTQSIESQ
ncbi:hypothetical protein CHS0354_007526 [Potamilus streckersoni]|uniref:Protein kinase domain-containing protein n=1 Tax=Potamilus streckersoni TaxID=2493646 RepID=A0AAE0W7Y8_9BIVA|nr:hypothetical protein CHS0354_007526 [Potamilus streckersoni]